MFFENCGNNNESSNKFCTKCGRPTTSKEYQTSAMGNQPRVMGERWWQRLLKVLYIFVYLQILWIVPAVWYDNSTSYVGYYGGKSNYQDTPGEAFWYAVLTAVIFVVVLRLIKITVLYVLMGIKPEWRSEFRKLF